MNDSKTQAIGIVRNEHRTLAAVVNNMKALLAEVKAERMPMDFRLFWSMIHYIDVFPNLQHHPKEEQWLFECIRRRTDVADALIAELQRQHQEEPQALNTLRRCLGNLEAEVPGSFDALESAVAGYADFTWKHLRREEQDLLPVAEAHLADADWDLLAREFGRNRDPLSEMGSISAENGALFRDIVARTPAPLGLGPAAHR